MDLLQGLALITAVHFLAAASPGPDFVLVSQQTLSHGKRTGLLCSLGIALGLSIHIIYSSLGLAAVIANSTTLLWIIKVLGGAYLIWLGINGLRAKAVTADEEQIAVTQQRSALRTVGMGFLCNALNPKAPVYFISLFTLVLSADMPAWQLAIYGAWMMVIQLTWFSSVVMMLSNPVVNRRFKAISHWIDRVLGGAMVLLGLKVLISRV
ncbi:MAG: LysE family transporter [Amphritea sp.]|nr:LysE family transporter [Amphritea sp.]